MSDFEIPFWDDEPAVWDRVIIGGVYVPGIAKVGKPVVADKLDVNEAPGEHGASIAFKGYKPCRFSIECTVWKSDQWFDLVDVLESIRPRPGAGKKQAVDISHPTLAVWGISAVYIEEIEGPEHDKKEGTVSVTLKCIEYFPPPKAGNVTTTPQAIAVLPTALGGSGTGGDVPFGPPLPPSAKAPKP